MARRRSRLPGFVRRMEKHRLEPISVSRSRAAKRARASSSATTALGLFAGHCPRMSTGSITSTRRSPGRMNFSPICLSRTSRSSSQARSGFSRLPFVLIPISIFLRLVQKCPSCGARLGSTALVPTGPTVDLRYTTGHGVLTSATCRACGARTDFTFRGEILRTEPPP